MLRPIRVYDPAYLHEITLRTDRGEHLLDLNCGGLRRLLQGALAECAQRYCIKVVAFHFLSNHYHGLFKIPSAPMFVRFLTAFHSAMAAIVNNRRDKGRRVWAPNRWFPVTQDAETVALRISYIMGQAVAAKLVDHPAQFPGPSSNDWMIDGKPVLGEVFDATQWYRDSQLKGGPKAPEEYTKTLEVPMVPPDCWGGLSSVQLREVYRGIADQGARVPLAELLATTLAQAVPHSCGIEQPPMNSQPGAVVLSAQQSLGQRHIFDFTPELQAQAWIACTVAVTKVGIVNRVDQFGLPYSAGPPKRKKRDGRSGKAIYILCADAEARDEYGRQYLELVDVYRAAKSAWRKTVQVTADGVFAGGLHLPPHTLFGTMPLVD